MDSEPLREALTDIEDRFAAASVPEAEPSLLDEPASDPFEGFGTD